MLKLNMFIPVSIIVKVCKFSILLTIFTKTLYLGNICYKKTIYFLNSKKKVTKTLIRKTVMKF